MTFALLDLPRHFVGTMDGHRPSKGYFQLPTNDSVADIFFKMMSKRKNRNTTNDITTKVSYVALVLVVIAKLCAQPEQYSCQAVKGSQAETTKVEIIS